MIKLTRVAVAGGFDPFHEGHLDHIKQASRLGDYLIVMINSDRAMIEKKGRCYEPLWFRTMIIKAVMSYYNIRGKVTPIIDKDLTCTRTLYMVKPDIFAKGGDRTPDNMPQDEIDACNTIHCRIQYGIGRKLNSSSSVGVEKCLTY